MGMKLITVLSIILECQTEECLLFYPKEIFQFVLKYMSLVIMFSAIFVILNFCKSKDQIQKVSGLYYTTLNKQMITHAIVIATIIGILILSLFPFIFSIVSFII